MRQVVLDTETTGLDPKSGHRIIEIGCIEIIQRTVTENYFHEYLQPDIKVDKGAMAVHGITDEFLEDKPLFADVAEDFINYIQGAELIIHNAPFDIGFLNAELKRLGKKWGNIGKHCEVLDTLVLARSMFPGQKNSLDALCKRYEVDNTKRDLHGALLDAQLLADVYLQMTGGQISLALDTLHEPLAARPSSSSDTVKSSKTAYTVIDLPIIKAEDSELAEHQAYIKALKGEINEFKS